VQTAKSQGGDSPGKPGKVREFKSGQGKLRENSKSQGKCVVYYRQYYFGFTADVSAL